MAATGLGVVEELGVEVGSSLFVSLRFCACMLGDVLSLGNGVGCTGSGLFFYMAFCTVTLDGGGVCVVDVEVVSGASGRVVVASSEKKKVKDCLMHMALKSLNEVFKARRTRLF